MKIYVDYYGLHYKNKIGLKLIIKKYFFEVDNIEEADICYFPSKRFDTLKYPTKKFIFGPSFSTFPNSNIDNQNIFLIDNKYNNAIYIQPSKWTKDVFLNDFNIINIPIYILPFAPDINKFKPNKIKIKNECFIYFKRRKIEELNFIKNYLIDNNYNPIIFDYMKGYKEKEYIQKLNKCKFGIYIGTHESQGFALQEALLLNVPLLIWNVTKMNQEEGCNKEYNNIKTIATSIPYWNEMCGDYFFTKNEFINKFNIFISNILNYKPREQIINLLSIDSIYYNYFYKILNKFFNYKMDNVIKELNEKIEKTKIDMYYLNDFSDNYIEEWYIKEFKNKLVTGLISIKNKPYPLTNKEVRNFLIND